MALILPSETAPEQHDPAADLLPENFRTLEDLITFCDRLRDLGHGPDTIIMVRNASGFTRQITGFEYDNGIIKTGSI